MRRSKLLALLIFVVLLPTVSEAAIARRGIVEGHTGSGSSSCTTGTFASNPVTGDTMVVAVSTFNTAATMTAPTDTGSNTYTQIGTTLTVGTGSTAILMSVWRKENLTGAASFTVVGHMSGSTLGCTVIAWDLSGAATTSYNADKTGTTGSTANPASGTSTPAPAASSFFIGAMTMSSSSNTVTAGSGWTFETNSTQTDNTNFQALYTEDLSAGGNVSSSAQSATFTEAADSWDAQVQSFAPSGGGGATSHPCSSLRLLGVGCH